MAKKKHAARTDRFLLIPASVIHDPRISSLAEAAVFSLVLGFSRNGELMRGGRAFAAEWTLMTPKWAGRTLLTLERKGLIHKVLLSRKGSIIHYGYYAEGFTREDSSLVTREESSLVTGEETSLVTGEVSSHRKYIGKNYKGNSARARAYHNPFNDFEQHEYDFDEIERILTQ